MMDFTNILEFLEQYDLSFLNLIFIGFTLTIVIFGSLITLVESHLPVCIRQAFRYGKHGYKGRGDPIINRLEVPKSWFKHFYSFAFAWSLLALFLMIKCFILREETSEIVLAFLDFMAGSKRTALINSNTAFVATVLMNLQTSRRFIETNYIQIFSKSKINLSHYIVGYMHYFGAIIALLANTEGFVRGTQPTEFSISNITLFQYLCLLIFHFAWLYQYKSNMVLVDLRRDIKTGKVSTERHFIPRGAFFELISSPHMFHEIAMYTMLWGLQYQSTTWLYITIWVFSNQVVNGILAHRWYLENFKNYPKDRYAILPYII